MNSNEKLYLKYLYVFQFYIYLFVTIVVFFIFFIYPIFLEIINNRYTLYNNISDNYSDTINDALVKIQNNWLKLINPFSNVFIRFFLAASIFYALLEKTQKSYKELKKINES